MSIDDVKLLIIMSSLVPRHFYEGQEEKKPCINQLKFSCEKVRKGEREPGNEATPGLALALWHMSMYNII